MRVLFNAAMRWELIPYSLNPMGPVRVKNGSKRKREPTILWVDEFQEIFEHIPEPFRTMCVIAMCMGLRISEILGLKWCAVDWDRMQLEIRQSYVYGNAGFPEIDAATPVPGGNLTSTPIGVCFAAERGRLGICKSRHREALLAE
jgi:integrase